MAPRMRHAYEREPTDLAEVARSRGYMSGLEVLRIGAWIGTRSLASVTLNAESAFEDVTGSAIQAINGLNGLNGLPAIDHATDDGYWAEWMRVASNAAGEWGKSGLMSLQGVDYPMASGVLAILDPKVWPVFDAKACHTIFGPKVDPARIPRRLRNETIYAAYARHLAVYGTRAWPNADTIHALDQCATAASSPPDGWSYAAL
jgi:hypothetical protein